MKTSEIMSAMIFGDGGASKIEELSTDGGSTDAGKVLVVGDNGKIAASDLTVGEGEVAVDKTFKVTGAAADSKAVGDAIDSLNGSLDTLKADLTTAVGSAFNLSAGYYNSSGVVVSNDNYRHTDILNESFIREDFNITPNSVGVWNNGAYKFKYWSQRGQLTTFDSIVYNFQTPHTTVVCISNSYLSNKVSSLDSDLSIEKTKTGQEFTLTQGYYNASGVLVDDSAHGCTEKLLETTIRRGFIPTPNSVVAWKNGTPIQRNWANVDQITSFDTIVYNFQTTERKAYDLTPSYLSKQVEKLVDYASRTMDFVGKKVAIIGDSISTNGDYSAQNPYGNVPEIIIETADVGVTLQAYPTYYDIGVTVGGHEITLSDVGSELTFTPTADDVGKMVGKPVSHNPASTIVWWEILQQQLGIEPIPVCWSGSSITSHNNDDNKLKTSHAWHDATIRKCGIRIAGTMDRVAPDIIIIYRGTNDFSHVPYTRITNNYYDSVPWRYPDTDVITDGYGYLQGLCLTVKKLRTAYPNAIIFLCTMNTFKRVDDSLFAIDNDRNTLPQYSKAIRETADFLGCNVINFDKNGITYENCYSEGYITDSASHPTHPSNKGHKVMGNRALLDLVTQCNSIT